MASVAANADIIEQAIKVRSPRPWLLAIVGVPGSGKSTIARELAQRRPNAAVAPMDGYHLPRSALNADQLERRGAPDTFDAEGLRDNLVRLREQRCGSFPAFDHAVKDPEPDAITIPAGATLVIVEGLYLLLRDWRMEQLFDFRVFVDVDPQIAVRRLTARHLECGLAGTPEASLARAEGSDAANARLILTDGCRERADLIV